MLNNIANNYYRASQSRPGREQRGEHVARVIDVHNHYYPPEFVDGIARLSTSARITRDSDGETRIEYAGDYSVIVEAHQNPEKRIADMDRAGVDLQVLSLTVPGVHFEEPSRGIELARVTNDAFGEIVEHYPDRLSAFATLPTQDPSAAARELERAVNDLGLFGAMIFSNLNGKALDHPDLWPIYEAAEALKAPLIVHPIGPASLANMEEMRLVALLGFPFDMTLAAARLALSGVLDRFPNLILIMSQLGGALPMLAERVERGYAIYPELSGTLRRSPTEYFREMYYDTVPYGTFGIPATYELAGPERILVGSDYPHQIGDLNTCTDVVRAMNVSDTEKDLMLGGNVERLLARSK